MRCLLSLFILICGACSIIVGNHAPVFCDGSEPRCDGSVLVRCVQGLEIKKDCGADICSVSDALCIGLCGDGSVGDDEECDDGNQENTDSCKNNCEENTCGDGVLLVGVEECDDANGVDTDFCKSDCKFNECGDGAFFAGTEECDDADQIDTDECSNDCKLPRCGDQIVQPDEDCDDGNTSQDDGCLNDCTLNSCGDGFVNPSEEDCDDTNQNNSDSCLNSCESFSCGDGFVAAGQEQCDGSNLSGESCTSLGFIGGNLSCSGSCRFNTLSCDAGSTCGNSVVDAGEECDDGNNLDTDNCLSNCNNADCGDGFVKSNSEECDDQNGSDEDFCKSDCSLNICGDGIVLAGTEQCDDQNASTTDACVACKSARCGDGFVQAVLEECDDQNTSENDGCKSDCTENVCGDGALFEGTEQCDDGNQIDGDGCDSSCVFTPNSSCGDGVINGAETCDDGSTSPNDGCDPSCVLEADIFVLCSGSGSTGDGTLESPFGTIAQAMVIASIGSRIMVLPQSTVPCDRAIITKSLTLFGLSDSTSTALPAPAINGGSNAALELNVANGKVIVKNLNLQSSGSQPTVRFTNTTKLALLQTSITNATGLAIECNAANGSQLFLDRSLVSNSPKGGLRLKGSCRAVVSNSLFQNNGSPSSTIGAIATEDANTRADVIFSTFDGNVADKNSVMDRCGAENRGRIDSSIINQNNLDKDGNFEATEDKCQVSFTDTFGGSTPGDGNINADPLFSNGFHLGSTSPCIDSANPSAPSLLFDPFALFGVDVFGHDFEGNPRIPGEAHNMGMYEE